VVETEEDSVEDLVLEKEAVGAFEVVAVEDVVDEEAEVAGGRVVQRKVTRNGSL